MISCRAIAREDLDTIRDLLIEGFPRRNKSYWISGLKRLAAYGASTDGAPLGYSLVADGTTVGVLLVISSRDPIHGGIRRNFSCWYVRPEFRSYASFLSKRAQGMPGTLINVSPASNTIATIESQGFRQFNAGMFAALASWRGRSSNIQIRWSPQQWACAQTMSDGQRQLLMDHLDFGCIGLWLETAGMGFPFIFKPRRIGRGLVPASQLIYAPDLETVEKFHEPIGRFLAARGLPIMLICTDRRLDGPLGRHFPQKRPMYFSGRIPPSVTDLGYTEAAIFGF